MRTLRSSLYLCAACALVAAGALAPAPALADHSVGVGYFAPTPDTKSPGVVASAGMSLPIVPIAPQVTVAVPFSGGRYAVTGEGRVRYYGTTFGAGVGVARLVSRGPAGTIWDGFVSRPIAPLLSLEARYYGFGSNNNGSTGYVGVRLGLP